MPNTYDVIQSSGFATFAPLKFDGSGCGHSRHSKDALKIKQWSTTIKLYVSSPLEKKEKEISTVLLKMNQNM
jgi:hypothetical protein